MEILPKEADPLFNEKLKELLESMRTWNRDVFGYDLEDAIRKFMLRLRRYYFEYFQYHLEEAKMTALPFQDLLISHTALISRLYVSETWERISALDKEFLPWNRACFLQSGIEAFDAMFGAFTGRPEDTDFTEHMEDAKDNIKGGRQCNPHKKSHWNPDKFPCDPKKIPKSHWWWFVDFDR